MGTPMCLREHRFPNVYAGAVHSSHGRALRPVQTPLGASPGRDRRTPTLCPLEQPALVRD
jgi:hypothetical protein